MKPRERPTPDRGVPSAGFETVPVRPALTGPLPTSRCGPARSLASPTRWRRARSPDGPPDRVTRHSTDAVGFGSRGGHGAGRATTAFDPVVMRHPVIQGRRRGEPAATGWSSPTGWALDPGGLGRSSGESSVVDGRRNPGRCQAGGPVPGNLGGPAGGLVARRTTSGGRAARFPLCRARGGPPTARSGVVLPVVRVGLISPSGHVGSTARETGMGWRVDPASSTGAAS